MSKLICDKMNKLIDDHMKVQINKLMNNLMSK